MQLKLSKHLDRGALRKAFKAGRLLHVPGVLNEASAKELLKVFENEVPWSLVYNEGDRHVDMPMAQVANLTPDAVQKIRLGVMTGAQTGFQYLYNNYPIFDNVTAGNNAGLSIHAVHDFVNSDEFIGLIHDVTGFDDIVFADSQATAYEKGHFLTEHNDAIYGKDRRLAYVISLTPKWRVDWGGQLQFVGKDGNVDGGFVPTFNALNMFEIPARHLVSPVSPFAGGIRYSVTGWLRTREQS